MKYLVIGFVLFGLYAFMARFVPALLLSASLPVVVVAAVVIAIYVGNKVR